MKAIIFIMLGLIIIFFVGMILYGIISYPKSEWERKEEDELQVRALTEYYTKRKEG